MFAQVEIGQDSTQKIPAIASASTEQDFKRIELRMAQFGMILSAVTAIATVYAMLKRR